MNLMMKKTALMMTLTLIAILMMTDYKTITFFDGNDDCDDS